MPAPPRAAPRSWPVAAAGVAALLAVALHTAADVAGTLLRPGYSPVRDLFSELFARAAPHERGMAVAQGASDLLFVPVAAGLHRALRPSRPGRLGPGLLMASGVLALAAPVWFRCDPGCLDPETARGWGHFVFAVAGWVAYLGGVLACARRMRHDPQWEGLARYSAATFAAGVALASLPVLTVSTSFVGLSERVFFYGAMQWLVVVGIALLRTSARDRDGANIRASSPGRWRAGPVHDDGRVGARPPHGAAGPGLP